MSKISLVLRWSRRWRKLQEFVEIIMSCHHDFIGVTAVFTSADRDSSPIDLRRIVGIQGSVGVEGNSHPPNLGMSWWLV